MAAHLLYSC